MKTNEKKKIKIPRKGSPNCALNDTNLFCYSCDHTPRLRWKRGEDPQDKLQPKDLI